MSTVAVGGDGVALLYAAIILLVLTWITVSMRVCVRLWRKVLGADDYLMIVGLVSAPPYTRVSHHLVLMFVGYVLNNSMPLHSLLLLWLWPKIYRSATFSQVKRNQGIRWIQVCDTLADSLRYFTLRSTSTPLVPL